MEETIRSAGHEVLGLAADERRALQLATIAPPDLGLIDLTLAHGESGAFVANVIRNLYGTPTLFISGTPDGCRHHAKSLRALGCLVKPFSAAVLVESLADAECLIRGKQPANTVPDQLEVYETPLV